MNIAPRLFGSVDEPLLKGDGMPHQLAEGSHIKPKVERSECSEVVRTVTNNIEIYTHLIIFWFFKSAKMTCKIT
jgi:hypothetical protein